jgi:predicted nuclease with RNAse H fold
VTRWAGVDVGGKNKGFHVAVVEGNQVTLAGRQAANPTEVVRLLRPFAPVLVAVDSPRTSAADGETCRPCEREFFRAQICHLYWTPSRSVIKEEPFYEWMDRGLDLYDELVAHGFEAIECFPTASWTVWLGPRGSARRTSWSRRALDKLERDLALEGIPPRLGQDSRDAIAAALTARCYDLGGARRFGDLVVPCRE